MRHTILVDTTKLNKIPYSVENELTDIFEKNYKNIISEKSLWIRKPIKFKSGNFKDSINDGFILVWENTTTPILYLTEIELEKHSIDRHILPQIGDFISFIQRASGEELSDVKSALYKEIKSNTPIYKKIQEESDHEVHELIENAIDDLQILLVIDKMAPELSIGLSQIEKAINIKIRKIEVSRFIGPEKQEIISYVDSEDISVEETEIPDEEEEIPEEYTIERHTNNKPEDIQELVKNVIGYVTTKVDIIPTKHYIGFSNDKMMIFSILVRRKGIVFYSKEALKDIDISLYKELKFRDVSNIGHYTTHLPTEIVISDKNQLSELNKYIDSILEKYGIKGKGME